MGLGNGNLECVSCLAVSVPARNSNPKGTVWPALASAAAVYLFHSEPSVGPAKKNGRRKNGVLGSWSTWATPSARGGRSCSVECVVARVAPRQDVPVERPEMVNCWHHRTSGATSLTSRAPQRCHRRCSRGVRSNPRRTIHHPGVGDSAWMPDFGRVGQPLLRSRRRIAKRSLK